jgi:hypothetical protein
MAEHIEIVASDFDTLKVERVYTYSAGDPPDAMATVSGVECMIGARKILLDHGLAICGPTSPAASEFWPVSCTVRIDGGPPDERRSWTDHPEIIRALRHYRELEAAGKLLPNMEL